jgi:hypothetical protein
VCASSPPLRGSTLSCVRWTKQRRITNYGAMPEPASTLGMGRAEGISVRATASMAQARNAGCALRYVRRVSRP